MKTISISTKTFAAIWAARQEGEETEDAILSRLLAGSAAAKGPPAKKAAPTPEQVAKMHKQKVVKPAPVAPPKPKAAENKPKCGPKLSTTDLDLLS